ncbi:caspase, EACC1-associated type [Actinomadura chokoriensis]|uniref:SAV_2336 N-terminal domain-related protein n=1 Tax=Actinomadura chokoriensis TaxID=454156 RepID=A0ABV4QP07_9ACTN
MSEIDRLRGALAAIGPPPDARELSEMLWLACHITPAEELPAPAAPAPPPAAPDAAEVPQPPPPAPAPPPAREPLTGLHPRPAPGAEPAGEASEVLVPTAPMLADSLGVQRALRPLKRRVPSRHRRELDEEATAARIADTRLWTPVLVPSPERWLTLGLVVDTGPTMRLWRPLARELTETLIRQGAFQNVHVSYLDETGRVSAVPGAPPRDPGTLLDASGRHAVLVLTDCSGPHWWNGRAARAVRRWAQAGPTAILQPLAERLWRRTAAPTTPGLAVLPRPAAPNTGLRFTPFDGAAAPGVPVPVLEVAPRWFGTWARLVSGSGPQPTAMAALAAQPPGPAPVRRERELPVAERVRRFLSTASPDAAELAAHVAVSVPSLPVMRLIQHRILGGSGPGQLAEVLLSGLLRPVGDVRYEFVPGAREALLDTLPRPEALHTRHVLEAVSAEIERRAGTAAETFRALLPTDGGPITLTADTDHFALLTPETRTHIAPGPAPGADLLRLLGVPTGDPLGHWDGPPRETVLGLDSGGQVTLDVLHGHPALPHGLLTGSGEFRDALLRTIVLGLALNHSPATLNFVFAGFLREAFFTGLDDLPHIAAIARDGSANSKPIGQLVTALEAELTHRERILERAGVTTWDDYQAAVAEGASFDPLPALVVIIDNIGPLLDIRTDYLDALAELCTAGAPLGIRFIFCASEDELLPRLLKEHIGWNAGPKGDDGAFLHVFADRAHPHFQPVLVSLDTAAPVIERMRQRGPQARQIPWPAELATQQSVPQFDVLRLNGGGPSGMFHETWALPASEPRNPAIGHDADGNVLTLYPLDFSSGLPHGLIVGGPESRRRIVRAIALALAAGHSPANLNFAFAGLGEHPLGEPLDLPHVRYSADELLGHPDRLQRFFDFLSEELDARANASPRTLPGASDFDLGKDRRPETSPRLLVVADVSLTLPTSRPQIGEALLSLAQRGRSLGVQLLLTSTTTENTTIWDRFLPLLGWRIAAGPRPPAELQRVMGRASLAFPDRRTAYLLAGGGSPRRFTVAEEPPEPVVENFVRRTREHRPAPTAPDGGPVLANPRRSRAVLIGVSEYTFLPDLPAVRNNLEGLKRALCDPEVWGLPERNCVVLAEPSSAAQIVDAVDSAARESEDALLVYLAGHGVRDETTDAFSLALPASGPGGVDSVLPYDRLQRAIAIPDGPRHRVVLLDCSFGGLALRDLPLRPPSSDGGMFVMSSASGSEPANIAPGAAYTAFTGELIATLEEGLPGAPAGLGMTMLHGTLRERLIAKGRPRPAAGYVNDGGEATCLFRNRAYVAPRASPPEPPGTSAPGAARPSGPNPLTDAALLDRSIRELDRTVADVSVRATLRRLLEGEAAAIREGRPPRPRNLVVTTPYGPQVETLAQEYGRVLARLGVLSHGSVSKMSWLGIGGRLPDAAESVPRLFQAFRGGVLLIQGANEQDPANGYFRPDVVQALVSLMGGEADDSLIILCGGAERAETVRAAVSGFDEHFAVLDSIGETGAPGLPDMVLVSELPADTGGRIPIGVESDTREPVFVDFDEDYHLVIAGPPASGRANLVRLLIEGIRTRRRDREPRIHVFDAHGVLRSIAEEAGHPEPVGAGVGYTDSPEVFARIVSKVNGPPVNEVFLFVIDRDLDDDPLSGLPRILLSAIGHRVHIVLTRLLTFPDHPLDPLVSTLHDVGAPALLMGYSYGEETRLYGAEPPPRSLAVGRAVLAHRGRQRIVQIAHTSSRP